MAIPSPGGSPGGWPADFGLTEQLGVVAAVGHPVGAREDAVGQTDFFGTVGREDRLEGEAAAVAGDPVLFIGTGRCGFADGAVAGLQSIPAPLMWAAWEK